MGMLQSKGEAVTIGKRLVQMDGDHSYRISLRGQSRNAGNSASMESSAESCPDPGTGGKG